MIMMDVLPLRVGMLKTNCYLLSLDTMCILVDPGSDKPEDISLIKDAIGEKKLLVVIYTHNHFDHIMGGYQFQQVPHYMHPEDLETLKATTARYHKERSITITVPKKILPLTKTMHIGPFSFQVLHTPGHTKGSVCLFFSKERCILTGDTLFCGTCGRTDLLFGDAKAMKESLLSLEQLENTINVYPGHGAATTMNIEKKTIQALLQNL